MCEPAGLQASSREVRTAGCLADDLREMKGVRYLAERLDGWSRVLTRSTLREVGGFSWCQSLGHSGRADDSFTRMICQIVATSGTCIYSMVAAYIKQFCLEFTHCGVL